MGENAGFARAVNAGIAAGGSELVVLLNNDVDCAPDFLERLAKPFADASVGSAAPLLLRPSGERIDALGIVADATLACFVRLQGAAAADARSAGRAAAARAARRRGRLPPRGAGGVGGIDERIFMYGEDLDLALRLCAAGWRAVAPAPARSTRAARRPASARAAQRERGGFGRGYLLRRYGVLRGRAAPRALLTELIVVAGDLVISRDAAALRGRLAGWRAARGGERRQAPREARAAGSASARACACAAPTTQAADRPDARPA